MPQLALAHNPSRGFQFLLDIERKLNHALRHLFGWQAGKVLEHQLLDVEPHEIAQLERASTRSEDKIAVAAVDYDEVAFGIESRAPKLSGGPFKGVAGQSARVDDRRAHRDIEAVGDGDQRLCRAADVTL